MKDILDYLPYYLGCDYWTDNSQGNLNAHTLPNVIDMCRRNKGVQLHLRRLSDMTEDEIKELIGWEKMNAMYTNLRYKKLKDCINIEYAIDAGDEGCYSQFHSISFLTPTPDQFHYLLKQGFDLFGLIDNNLAIDAKTTNPPL